MGRIKTSTPTPKPATKKMRAAGRASGSPKPKLAQSRTIKETIKDAVDFLKRASGKKINLSSLMKRTNTIRQTIQAYQDILNFAEEKKKKEEEEEEKSGSDMKSGSEIKSAISGSASPSPHSPHGPQVLHLSFALELYAKIIIN